MRVSEVARIWQQSGVSVLPIPADKSKRPDRKWAQYQVTAPTLEEVTDWWGNGHSGYGLAIICGAVSGDLEMTELEGRALNTHEEARHIGHVEEALRRLGVWHVWEYLTGPEGFSEMSPYGGLHLLYRLEGAPVPGNTKIARRLATPEELAENPLDKIKVLAETRGEGGYVVTAPSPGTCHPSGEPWTLIYGQYGKLPIISWEERNLIHQALFEALDQMPVVAPPQTPAALPARPPATGLSAAGSTLELRPGDRWAAQTTFGDLLSSAGWTMSHTAGVEEFWVRPGKNPRDGHSATVNYQGSGLLYVFSTAVEGLESETSYTKFGAYAHLFHGGDMRRAAQELADNGWGTLRPTMADFEDFVPAVSETVEPDPVDESFSRDELGNALMLARRAGPTFRFVQEEDRWYRWDGKQWRPDLDKALWREFAACTDELLRSPVEADRKWGSQSRSLRRISAAVKLVETVPGMTVSATTFNPHRHLLNVANGVLDLQDAVLRPHDKSLLMTRMFNASYNPQAQCPEFEAFMERALPDPSMRGYVQRALGYSLLGDADQRSVFLIHGPSGTGKSTLMETMREIFGEYGTSAPASTFRGYERGGAPNNDVHGLRGKRFVTTSETSEKSSFDEDLIKRISGRDAMKSRELYQRFIEWIPECALWIATNHPPKFTSDDNAIWARTKLIPFLTVFTGSGERRDMSRSVLVPERDGILNWLLAGLRDYLEHGLREPEQVRELAAEQRSQSDSVARFVEDKLADGILVVGEDQRMRSSELYSMYLEWARQMGEKPLGNRRVYLRMQSLYPDLGYVKSNGYPHWQGLGKRAGVGVLGSFIPDLPD